MKGKYYRSPERIKELARQIKGVRRPPLSEKEKQAISKRNLGNKYALGLKKIQENKNRISQALKGRPSPLKGKKIPIEVRRRLSLAQRKRVLLGKHNFWKGGINKINLKIRGSLEYRLWRESVYARDNHTCVWCGQRGGKLNADHIKPFALYPELRFAIDNGRTLCVPCHRKTDTWGHHTSTKRLKQKV